MAVITGEARAPGPKERDVQLGENSVYIKKPLSKGNSFAYSLDLYMDTVFVSTHYREGM